ncbi:hypothetical protein HYX10_06290 [Candidatus Woesearchaeota archaeon]|nr:hypothetical protein [Candidatus Woesearchaeota archaeon]
MDKKAQALSLNTIVVAIVVLIVLVVLIMVFTGYFGTRFTPEVTSCANAGGTCEDACGTDAFGEPLRKLSASCTGLYEGKVCCAKGLGGSAPSDDGNLFVAEPPECSSDDCYDECPSGTSPVPNIVCANSAKTCCA